MRQSTFEYKSFSNVSYPVNSKVELTVRDPIERKSRLIIDYDDFLIRSQPKSIKREMILMLRAKALSNQLL